MSKTGEVSKHYLVGLGRAMVENERLCKTNGCCLSSLCFQSKSFVGVVFFQQTFLFFNIPIGHLENYLVHFTHN